MFSSALFIGVSECQAQRGYEFEVYGAEIPGVRGTELEASTNIVPSGSQRTDSEDGRATHHAVRSSFEVTRGITTWLATSLYATLYGKNGRGISYVGNRGRVTLIAPARWNLPFNAGLANEVSFARDGFAEHKWTYEITPIVDRDFGKVSVVLNPAFERSLDAGPKEWEFEPRGRLGFAIADKRSVGLEYYSVLGPVTGFDSGSHQNHQVFLTGSTELGSGMEAGLGVGRGLTRDSDRWVVTSRIELKF